MIADLDQRYRTQRSQSCRAIAGDRTLGEDAVQDAFARAVRKRRSYRGRGSLEAWVWRIVVNAARDADLDYATIAEALGISPGTVCAALSTARRVLRQALAPEVKS